MLTLGRLINFANLFQISVALLVAIATTSAFAKPPSDQFVAAGVDDASLNAVSSTSPDRVWAVGDRGAIWATTDGGRKWIRQDSGTTANLYGVAFKTSAEGCAVGGMPGALSRTSRSVVLRTDNGGETWNVVPSDGVPRLTGMRAIGGRLFAWGDYNPQRKTGIFVSADNGQSWQGIESSNTHIAALGADAIGNILAVDRVGNAFNSQLGPLRSFFTANPHQPVAFVEHLGSTWLAGGADGQLMRTVDAQTWSRVALPLSAAAQRVCQWRTAAQFEDQIWIAGSPGSIVLHSTDRGLTWHIQSTEQTLPMRSITFADAQRGWAVGPLGTIIATRDGGSTWYPQRKTATRVGLMAVTATDDQVPWPALVATSWDDAVASKSLSLFGGNLEQSADYRVESWKLNEALAPQVGLVEHQAWLQPKPMGSSLLDLTLLTDRLTIELRSWRPDVVLTDETGGQKLSLANRAAMLVLATAIQQAAATTPASNSTSPIIPSGFSGPRSSELSPSRPSPSHPSPSHPSIAEELMLPPWQTTKLATVTEGRSSQYSEHLNRLMRDPGLSIWDVLAPLSAPYDANSSPFAMRTIQQNKSSLANNASLLGGIAPSRATQRQISLRSLGNYQLIMGRVHRMTSLDSLANLPPETPLAEWQTQLDFIVRSLPPRELSSSLLRVANACSAPMLWPRRQIAFDRIIQLQPESDSASYSRFKLLQMLSSNELQAWQKVMTNETSSNSAIGDLRNDSGSSLGANASSLTPFDTVGVNPTTPTNATAPIGVIAPFNAQVVTGDTSEDGGQVSAAAFSKPSNTATDSETKERFVESQNLESFFKFLDNCYKSDPSLANVPQLELMRDAMMRNRTDFTSTSTPTSVLESLARLTALAGWPQVAQQELVLSRERPEQLRWVSFAVATSKRPRLDGVLDEPMWSVCPPMKLIASSQSSSHESSLPATVRWSFDDRYLYIGIDSPRATQLISAPAPRQRKYDSDLQASDHLHFMLDTDRDYASAVELGVSSEGETFDRCCEMTNFNPHYAVAVPDSPRPDRWVVEIAIRLADLTTKTDMTGQAWAVSAHRRSPQGHHQSWSSMLSDQPSLQSAGLLLFVQPPTE